MIRKRNLIILFILFLSLMGLYNAWQLQDNSKIPHPAIEDDKPKDIKPKKTNPSELRVPSDLPDFPLTTTSKPRSYEILSADERESGQLEIDENLSGEGSAKIFNPGIDEVEEWSFEITEGTLKGKNGDLVIEGTVRENQVGEGIKVLVLQGQLGSTPRNSFHSFGGFSLARNFILAGTRNEILHNAENMIIDTSSLDEERQRESLEQAFMNEEDASEIGFDFDSGGEPDTYEN